MIRSLLTIAILGLAFTMTGCGYTPPPPTSEQMQNQQQEQVNKQAVESVGMPSIVNFAEKRLLKDIYELRDKSISTVTYTKDMNGHAHKFCSSLGFGIPYATQYSSPQQPAMHTYSNDTYQHYGGYAVPQADPNGLYSPAAAEGTWVMCVGKKSHKPHPVYVEDRVFTVIAGEDYDGLQ